MKNFESVIVVGSSGSGKTTLVNGLRGSEYQASVTIPRRYITRPERLGDDLVENYHLTKEAFEERVIAGYIQPHWSRGLVVMAMATAESRDIRLDQRSPDMSDTERAVRLSDAGIDILAGSIEIIDTTNLSPAEGQNAFQNLIDQLIV